MVVPICIVLAYQDAEMGGWFESKVQVQAGQHSETHIP